jgi:hypothetical protein
MQPIGTVNKQLAHLHHSPAYLQSHIAACVIRMPANVLSSA